MIPVQFFERPAVPALGVALLLLGSPGARAQGPPPSRPPAVAPSTSCAPDAPTGFGSKQVQMERVSETHWKLSGLVEVECERVKFFADAIEIFTDTNRLVATGNVVFTSPLARVAAESADFDTKTLTGVFTTASGTMTMGRKTDRALFAGQDPDVYFYGATVERVSDRQYRISEGGFTTCVQPTPRWELVSGHAVITIDDHAVLRNTVLRVKGVPLMYLPYAYYPLKDGQRATGFLLPTYGTSTLRGQAISNAFFLAMGRSQDATIFHDLFTRTGQGVGGEYRYVAGPGSLGNVRTYLFSQHAAQFSSATSLPAATSFEVKATINQTLGTHMRVRSQVDYFSSLITQQLYQQNVYAASNRQRVISGSWSGTWHQYSLTSSYQRSELLGADKSSLTYGGAPRLTGAISPVRLFGWPVYGSLQTELARNAYETTSASGLVTNLGLWRYGATPTLRVPLSRWPFLTVNSSATWQNMFYSNSLDANFRFSQDPISRHYLDLRTDVTGPTLTRIWDFGEGQSEDGGGIQRLKHVIEPFAELRRVTGTDNLAHIVQGYDTRDYVVQGMTSLTYGLTNRMLVRPRPRRNQATTSTLEFLTVTLQQTYYTQPRAGVFDVTYASASRLSGKGNYSPVALSARATPRTGVSTTARMEFDPDSGTPISTSLQESIGPLRGLSITTDISRVVRQITKTAPQIFDTVIRAGGQFTGHAMRASYSLTRDMARGYNVQQSVGWSYNAQCCGVAVDYQAFNYPIVSGLFPIASDRRIHFSVVLAGLGTFQNFFGAFGGVR